MIMRNMQNNQKIPENWVLEVQKPDDEYLHAIFSFVLAQFVEIFGLEMMCKEKCVIYNESESPYPMLVLNCHPIRIRLSMEKLSYWCQLIFQLSHEMMHYVVRQCGQNKSPEIKWFEETLCEAVSLYVLKQSSVLWSSCDLATRDLNYGRHIEEYFNDNLNKTCPSSILQSCRTLIELQEIEQTCMTPKGRLGRSLERNLLYEFFCNNPHKIALFSQYRGYVNPNSNLQLDLDKWGKDLNSDETVILRKIHPKIIGQS